MARRLPLHTCGCTPKKPCPRACYYYHAYDTAALTKHLAKSYTPGHAKSLRDGLAETRANLAALRAGRSA